MASALASARRAYATGTDAVERVACTGGLLALSLCGAPLSLASAAIGASSLARGTLLAQAAAAWRATLAERNGFLAFAVVDALFGLAFFCLWVLYREKSVLSLAAWLALIAATGSGGASIYILTALARSRGEWARFWMGDRAPRPAAKQPYDTDARAAAITHKEE